MESVGGLLFNSAIAGARMGRDCSTGTYMREFAISSTNIIAVNSASDFAIGDEIVIFKPDNTEISRMVINKSDADKTLTLDIPVSDLIKYDGVRLNNSVTYEIPLFLSSRLQDAYGFFGNGDDTQYDEYLANITPDGGPDNNHPSGGAFVEYVFLEKGNPIPLMSFTGVVIPSFILELFPAHWAGDPSDGIFTVFYGGRLCYPDPPYDCETGFTNAVSNWSIVLTEKNTVSWSTNENLNTYCHELGHQYGIPYIGNQDSHTDNDTYNGVIKSNDTFHRCMMSYRLNGANPTHYQYNSAEFCTHHKNPSPGNDIDESCIGDIRISTWPK